MAFREAAWLCLDFLDLKDAASGGELLLQIHSLAPLVRLCAAPCLQLGGLEVTTGSGREVSADP